MDQSLSDRSFEFLDSVAPRHFCALRRIIRRDINLSDPIERLLKEVIRTWEERTKRFLLQILEDFDDLLAAHQKRLRKVTQTEERNLKFLPNCFRMILCLCFLSKFFAVLYNCPDFPTSELLRLYELMQLNNQETGSSKERNIRLPVESF